MKLSKVLSSAAMAAVVVLTSVFVVDAIVVQPVNALTACVPGRTSTYAGSTYVEFTTVTAGCTWTVPTGVTSLTEVLIVAGGGGGGGGGTWAGGGGAGEVIGLSAVSVGSTVDIAVGAGGTTGNSSTCAIAGNGGNSYFVGGSGSTTAFGGGGGGPDNDGSCTPWKVATTNYIGGSSGGSGGGSGQSKYPVANSTATSTAHANGYGNNSGTYISNISGGGSRQGTGGGGASQAGGSITAVAVGSPGGKGGDGTDLFHMLINEAHLASPASSLGQLSASKYFVAGGGSGSSSTGNSSTTAPGGLGGGGKGSNKSNSTLSSCTSGTNQSGGGGGGGGGSGCVGGSGFVLIKYTTPVAVTYTITYDANSATSGSVPSAGSYRSGDAATTVASNSGTLALTGYSFAGWNTLADGSGTTYVAGVGTLTTSSNITLYAKWTVITYTITYNSNSATSGSVPSSQTKTYGVDLTVASNSGTLARTGYTFAGWNTLSDGSGTTYGAGSGTLTANLGASLYAKWTAITYTITYNANSATTGSVPSAGSYRSGDAATTVASNSGTLVRTGYSFSGWNTLADGSGTTYVAGSGTLTTSSNLTLYAKWSANTLTVTTDEQGGTAIGDASTTTGASMSSPGTPNRTGYTFTGWFAGASGGAAISFPYTHSQTSSFTLYAQWSANALTVTTDEQGGTAIGNSSTATGASMSSPGTPTRTGYTFNGWFATTSGGAAISFPYTHGQTASFTLYAQWTADSLTVTYDSQGGSSVTAGSTSTGSSIAASPDTPTRTGYTFTGWFAAASGGTAISFPYAHSQTSNFTLYAQWTANSLTVTYDSQGGSSITIGSTSTGSSLTASPGTPTLSGYAFTGWFAAASGGAAISFPYAHSQTSSFTLYAQWSANSLTVTYDSQGGSAITAGITTTGSSISSPSTPTRSGYTFAGWFVSAGGGAAISFPYAHGQTSSFTLYAQWTANSLTVTYDSQGGSSITIGSTSTGSSIAASPGTPTLSGYAFTGWFTGASGGAAVSFPYTHGQTASFTLFAQWSANSLTVTYDSQSGSAISSGSTTTGSSIASSPGTPALTGYTFAGWFTGASGGTAISFPYPHGQTSSFTLYAQWSANSLTVTTDEQGGTAIGNASTTTGASMSSPGTPTRTGYAFAGWFAASTGGASISFPYTHSQTSSFTLYAQWSANALTVTYDSQGGSSVSAGSTTTGSSITASPGTPTRTGYTLTGWFAAASGGAAISFPYTHAQTSSFTMYAQWAANSLTVTYDSQGGSAITAGSTTTGSSITASPGTPTRTGYTFTGWFIASTGGTAITFPYTHSQTSSFNVYAQWTQSSLYGLGSKTKIGTITTADGVGNIFAAETATSSVSLRYPADGLPAGTVIDVYLVNDLTRAGSLIAQDGGFVISLVVAWLAADSSIPLTASGKPISMTIANTTIKAGAKTYAIMGGVVTLIGTATSDGTVTVLISEDPEIVVVNPVAEAPSSSKPIAEPVSKPVSKPAASSPAASPVVPVVAPIVKIPTEIKNLVPVIPGAPSKISGILNPTKNGTVTAPKVVTPVVSAKGTTQRATIAPVQLRAVPIDAPTAPAGAKIVPIGSMIVASKEAPKDAESQVSTGEAKATFGGQPIVSTLQKSSDGVVLVSSGPSRIALAGFSSNSSAGLATSSSVPLEIATSSFIASTPVQVWLFSTPLLLAETTVDADGNFAVAINIPGSVPSGNHTLQIQGYAYTSSGAAEITSNIGISIAQTSGQTWSITFPQYVASISRNNQVAWTNFASGQGSSVLSCSLTGVSPSKISKANTKLFENRQTSLLTMLKYNGCVNVSINAPIAPSKSATLDRTWKVDVQPTTSSVTFKWSHNFKIYSSAIDRKQIPQWSALVTQSGSSNLACSVTGAESLVQSKANTQLFSKRNESLRQYLLSAGCSSVLFENPVSRSEKLASRTIWKVEVKSLN